eukprot:1872640-Amphidinium_carterae.1
MMLPHGDTHLGLNFKFIFSLFPSAWSTKPSFLLLAKAMIDTKPTRLSTQEALAHSRHVGPVV